MFTSCCLDEMQQQIERPLEVVEPDRIRLEDGFEFLWIFHVERAEGTEATENFLPQS